MRVGKTLQGDAPVLHHQERLGDFHGAGRCRKKRRCGLNQRPSNCQPRCTLWRSAPPSVVPGRRLGLKLPWAPPSVVGVGWAPRTRSGCGFPRRLPHSYPMPFPPTGARPCRLVSSERGLYSVSAVGGSDQRKQSLILVDRHGLPIAKRIVLGREIEAASSNWPT